MLHREVSLAFVHFSRMKMNGGKNMKYHHARGLQFGDIKDGVMTVQRSKLSLANKDVVRNVNKTYSSTRKLVGLSVCRAFLILN